MAVEGFQFIHESTYGRKGKAAMTTKTGQKRKAKWSGREIVAEAIRELGNCDHVESPIPPQYVLGNDLLAFWESIERKASEAKDTAGRKLRTDKQLLTAGVCSAPILTADFNPKDEFYQQWLQLNLDFLQNKYGEDLGPVILHTDEKYIHLHYYVAPEVQETEYGFTLEAYQDGLRAKNLAMKEGDAKTANIAYKQAMKAFQDSYYEQVAKPCGLTRSGPKRRRLSRDDWKEEKRLAAHVPQLQLEIEEAEQRAEEALITVDQAHNKLAQAQHEHDVQQVMDDFVAEADREREQERHREALELMADEKLFLEQSAQQTQVEYAEAKSQLTGAKSILNKAKNWQEKGAWVGAFFSNFNGVKKAYEKQIEVLQQKLKQQAKKFKADLNRIVKQQIKKETEKLNSILKLAISNITRLESHLKQANIDIEAEEQKNNALKEQNTLLIDKVSGLEKEINQNTTGSKLDNN